MEVTTKIPNYVLVCDVSHTGELYYYCGYYQNGIPYNTTDYTSAAKFIFKSEAEILAINISSTNKYHKYHVEEHMYI